jgi:hypothetical protein
MTLPRQYLFHPLNMHIGVLPAAAMPQINTKLEHLETISHNLLSEFGIYFPVLFSLGWQIKKYQNPHNAVCVKAFKALAASTSTNGRQI